MTKRKYYNIETCVNDGSNWRIIHRGFNYSSMCDFLKEMSKVRMLSLRTGRKITRGKCNIKGNGMAGAYHYDGGDVVYFRAVEIGM